ncbi:MAG: hypothetical protein Q9190_001900 [Brigantiaea leucoxantha]
MASPGSAPPNGDEKRGAGILATAVTLKFLSFVVTTMRMITRIWIVQSVGLDDYTIICAFLGAIIGFGLVIVEVHYGFGRHRYYLEKWDYIEAMKYSYGEWIQTFQTLISDPTWVSIDNWYWRVFEVNIGIIAANIPALRPGYRTVAASISSYLSRRTLLKDNTTRVALDTNSDKVPIAKTKENTFKPSKTPLRAAAGTASTEADRAQEVGAGDDGFAMKSLPGDKRTMEEGIKKTIRVDVDIESQKSLGLGGSETGEGNTSFI